MGFLNESLLIDLLVLIVTLIAVGIVYLKKCYTYWEKLGVPTITPSLPFGNAKDIFLKKTSFAEFGQSMYNQFKARGVPHGGLYMGINYTYMPISLELIKNIIQKDFHHFASHGVYHDEKIEPLSGHLFNLEGPKWKDMRVKLTPTFTSGKMKMMFQTFVDCSAGLKDVMTTTANNRTPVDIKEILARFTTDIIGSCAFGLECNSLKDPDAEFRKYGKRVFESTTWDRVKTLMRVLLPPKVLHAIGFKIGKPDVTEFFMKAVKDTVEYREKNNVFRKDFMHLLIQLKNRGKVTDDDQLKADDGTVRETLTMGELSAQAFVFFLAGFETSSTTMTFALFEIARHPDVQEKIREEINQVLAKYDHKLTYDAVMEMDYLHRVLEETLRKYPPVVSLPRQCTKDYQIPGTSIVIKNGTRVTISVMGIHYDPEYYPDPEKFDPDRFTEENKAKRPNFTWLPFGDGPRICIGLRFGLMQSKVGLIALIRNFKISLNEKTKVPLVYDKNGFIINAEGGIWLNVEAIK